ncbi:MAG: hypothetical protein RR365_05415 [Bacteroides sp.]
MKTFARKALSGAAFLCAVALTACSDDNNEAPAGGNGDGKDPEVTYVGTDAMSAGILFKSGTQLGNGDQHFHFTGDVTLKKGTYLMKGWVYIDRGAKLTIEPGTVIKGDKATKASLIVQPGGYVSAAGTKEAPIVMTSAQPAGQRRPGDWGGLIICGQARNNNGKLPIEGGPGTEHGGDNDADNSGIYQYLRVEFAGYPFQTDQEINGITFGSVGSGTTVDHLQVSYSNDDSYEWFGGTVNCKYLIAYKGWDDEFDTDYGYSGHVQFCLSVRDPRLADTSQSNGFESDNNATGAEVSPYTSALFSNVTFIGPMAAKNAGFANNADYINGGTVYPDNGSKLGKFQSAMQIRRSSKLSCYNSVAVGFPIGLIIDGEKGGTPGFARNGEFHLKNLVFAGMGALGSDNNKKYEDHLFDKATGTYDPTKFSYSHAFFLSEGNRELSEAALLLTDPLGVGQNYAPAAGSPLLTGAGFAGVKSAFLNTTVPYVGAFSGATDAWMEGWTNFDPQHTAY